jgi:hypothetical protein
MTREYNVKWEQYFKVDPKSDSGLVWIVDRVNMRKNGLITKAGSTAGSKLFKSNGDGLAWRVKLGGASYLNHRIIWCMLHGDVDKVLVIDHLDGDPFNNNVDNLELKTVKANNQNNKKYKNNSSGVVGVYFMSATSKNGRLSERWAANWYSPDGVRKTKTFSVQSLGFDGAKEAAINFRTEKVKMLNSSGQNYTDRHSF